MDILCVSSGEAIEIEQQESETAFPRKVIAIHHLRHTLLYEENAHGQGRFSFERRQGEAYDRAV